MLVKKRNGDLVNFDKDKITTAILKAFIEVNGSVSDDMISCANKISSDISKQKCDVLTVDEIQDIVEIKLMSTKYKEVAKAYTNYRYLHDMARNRYESLMNAVSEKLMASNVVNQNANVDEKSFGGRMGEANDVLTKRFALDYIVSPMSKRNHENNEIYIHDLNSYAVGMHNCMSVPFDDLLANGFNTRQTDVRPAQSVNTAFQLVAVIFQLQSLQEFGGVSATHIDWTMVPYVRKSFFKHFVDGLKYFSEVDMADIDNGFISESTPIKSDIYKRSCYEKPYSYAMDMTTKETYQAVEGMYHNLNTLQSRSGNQLNLVAGL